MTAWRQQDWSWRWLPLDRATAARIVGILRSTTSSISVTSANCWSPPLTLTSLIWLKFCQVDTFRMVPTPVPAGYFVVSVVSMPSNVIV